MKRYKAAIIGCGTIGHAHMEGYQKLDQIDVIACSDPVPAAVEYYKKEFNIPQGFSDFEEGDLLEIFEVKEVKRTLA